MSGRASPAMPAFVQGIEQLGKLARAELAHEACPIHLYRAGA